MTRSRLTGSIATSNLVCASNTLLSKSVFFVPVGIPNISSISHLEFCALLQHWCSTTVIYFLKESFTVLAIHNSDSSSVKTFHSSVRLLIILSKVLSSLSWWRRTILISSSWFSFASNFSVCVIFKESNYKQCILKQLLTSLN